jgi:hypothetical protein
MAQLASLPADAVYLSENIGCNIRSAETLGLLTDANVLAATSVADLQANILAASGPADIDQSRPRINRALDYGKYSGELSDARVTASTTIAELIALTADPSTDIRHQQFAC